MANRTATAMQELVLGQLDAREQATVLMALVAIALIFAALVLVVWLGGRYVKRLARHRLPPVDRGVSDWDRKQPLRPDDDLSLPDDSSD